LHPVPLELVETADALLPGAVWERARLGRGGSHDVVLLSGMAAVRIATHPIAAAELPRRVALLHRLAKAGLPFAVPEPLSEVISVGGRAAVALSWVDGAPIPRGEGDAAGIRACTWYLTFGLEQIAVALLRGDPGRVLADKVAQTVAWLDRSTRHPPPA
jgi:hypothetical protein